MRHVDFYAKLIQPAILPVIVFLLAWLVSWYGHRKYGDDHGFAKEGRAFAVMYGAWAYLTAWHLEIASAWMSYPQLTSFICVLLVPPFGLLLLMVAGMQPVSRRRVH
jgi:hypothetical protein